MDGNYMQKCQGAIVYRPLASLSAEFSLRTISLFCRPQYSLMVQLVLRKASEHTDSAFFPCLFLFATGVWLLLLSGEK